MVYANTKIDFNHGYILRHVSS